MSPLRPLGRPDSPSSPAPCCNDEQRRSPRASLPLPRSQGKLDPRPSLPLGSLRALLARPITRVWQQLGSFIHSLWSLSCVSAALSRPASTLHHLPPSALPSLSPYRPRLRLWVAPFPVARLQPLPSPLSLGRAGCFAVRGRPADGRDKWKREWCRGRWVWVAAAPFVVPRRCAISPLWLCLLDGSPPSPPSSCDSGAAICVVVVSAGAPRRCCHCGVVMTTKRKATRRRRHFGVVENTNTRRCCSLRHRREH